MKHASTFEQFLNEKVRPVKGTPFHVYWGGREIEGQCKWVIDIDDKNYNVLDALIMDGVDQLWCSKEEAIEAAQDWWNDNKKEWSKKLQENFATDNPELEQFVNEGGDPEKKKALRDKIRNLDRKEDDLMKKKAENAKKGLSEDDNIKSEIISLTTQKLAMQKAIVKIDMKITALKLRQEDAKPIK